jgi:hypothetical protein
MSLTSSIDQPSLRRLVVALLLGVPLADLSMAMVPSSRLSRWQC